MLNDRSINRIVSNNWITNQLSFAIYYEIDVYMKWYVCKKEQCKQIIYFENLKHLYSVIILVLDNIIKNEMKENKIAHLVTYHHNIILDWGNDLP